MAIRIKLYKTNKGIIVYDTMNKGDLCTKHKGQLEHIGTITAEGDTEICNFGIGLLIPYEDWGSTTTT